MSNKHNKRKLNETTNVLTAIKIYTYNFRSLRFVFVRVYMSGVGSGTAGHGMAWYVSDHAFKYSTVLLHQLTATKQNNKNKEDKNNNNMKSKD